MGILDWFARKTPVLSVVHAPSLEYATPLGAIEALIAANAQADDDSAWVTFDAESDGSTVTIEIAGDQINFCNREVDLSEVLISSNAKLLARRVIPGGRKETDRTC